MKMARLRPSSASGMVDLQTGMAGERASFLSQILKAVLGFRG